MDKIKACASLLIALGCTMPRTSHSFLPLKVVTSPSFEHTATSSTHRHGSRVSNEGDVIRTTTVTKKHDNDIINNNNNNNNNNNGDLPINFFSRRSFFLSSLVTATTAASSSCSVVAFAEEPPSAAFESIAARAAKISQKVEMQENVYGNNNNNNNKKLSSTTSTDDGNLEADTRTAYDFSLPVAGEQVSFYNLIKQENYSSDSESNNKDAKVKAILVVNIKQDDPIARKDIPEIIGLAAKYGPDGFAVVCLPSDQGYFEPDTSALIRLKMAQEYGYGINPATALTDKVNFLGTGAHPFMRWMQNKCRTPSGLGRIQGNYEKFLVDGRTGLPLRRYPRKYSPYDITADIQALLKSQRLPPASSNFNEEWRGAAYDSKQDTYRFQKGLNFFDQ